MAKRLFSLPLWQDALLCLVGIFISARIIPAEQTLGTGIRLIYLHGTWIWTAIGLYILAAMAGLIAILSHKPVWHRRSTALGYAGLIFLITYLPMALYIMKTYWNGFFFSEPRWSVPFSLAIASLLMQIGLRFIHQPVLTSLINLGYGVILVTNLFSLQSVLHPDSPVMTSGSVSIRLAYGLLFFFVFSAGLLLTLWLYRKGERGSS